MGDETRRHRPGLAVGRVCGVPLYLRSSLLLLAGLLVVVYGELVPRRGAGPLTGYLVGAGFVVCLLGSVLLHELGHALTARRYGIPVRGITLELLGGHTEMVRDADTPRVDLVVSLAGPVVSLLLGAVGAGLTTLVPPGTGWRQVAFQLAATNLVVAGFNLLPGLPLDGGRALRAVVWAVGGDRHRGTEVAAWAGRIIAVATVTATALLVSRRMLAPLALPVLLLVAFTLWRAAGQSLRVARMSRRFPLVDLARLARPICAVPAGTSLAQARRQASSTVGRPAVVGVTDSAGRLVAVVDPVADGAVPAGRDVWRTVDEVTRGIADLPRLPVGLPGVQVVEAVRAHPGAQYLVTAGEDVIGVLHIADLAHVLEPKRKMNT